MPDHTYLLEGQRERVPVLVGTCSTTVILAGCRTGLLQERRSL